MQQAHLVRSFVVVLVALLLAGRADASDVQDTVKESFKVRPGGTLLLDIDYGNVEVVSTGGDVVRIEVERSVDTDNRDEARRALERHKLTFRQTGGNVSIESRFDRHDGLWGKIRNIARIDVRILVHVPRRFNVDFNSGAGNVQIDDLDGDVVGHTDAGNIRIGAVTGSVGVKTGSGNVQVDGASGRVEANTGAGNVELREVRGDVYVNTGAGNITAYITEQPRRESHLSTGAGNVTVFLSERVGVEVNAEASMGAANTDFPLRVDGKWMRKSFGGRVNGGGPSLVMRAGVGNVSLRRQ